MTESLLAVEDLVVAMRTPDGPVVVVDDMNLHVRAGEIVALVGESGSGKTVTGLSILGLIRRPIGDIVGGRIWLRGRDVTHLSDREMRALRGREVSMIFQEPGRSLDPSFKVGETIAEVARRHLGLSRKRAWARAVELLDCVGIADADRRAHDYPHMFSGGMCQRVMLAVALVAEPALLIADEPTTALDVTVQAEVLGLLKDLQHERGLGVLLITHDLGVVAEVADRAAVMYAGQLVEEGEVVSLFSRPQHPYTAALLDCLPQLHPVGGRVVGIAGRMPVPREYVDSCRFADRCPWASEVCDAPRPALEEALHGRSRCRRHRELRLRGIDDDP